MQTAIIGDKKAILGFKALGIKAFGVENADDLERAKAKILENDFAIVFLTEEIASEFPSLKQEFYKETLPAVLVIPGVSQKTKIGAQELSAIMERALGSDKINF